MSEAHFAQNATDDWGTPQFLIDCMHRFFNGPPDLDPASSERHNRRVKAKTFLGLPDVDPVYGIPTSEWSAKKVFCNPPSGRGPMNMTLAQIFWDDMLKRHKDGAEVFWVAYNINQLQTLQRVTQHALGAPALVWIPSGRIGFVDTEGVEQKSPPGVCAVIILCHGERWDDAIACFGGEGMCLEAYGHPVVR